MTHELKILECYASAKVHGDKLFEIRDNRDRGFQKGDYDGYKDCTEYAVADALISAGIGDVSELQKECDSKEEAYNKCYIDYKDWKEKAKEYKHRAKIAEKAFDLINKENPSCFVPYSCRGLDCRECTKKYFYEQAEKELQEETNNV